MKTKLNINVTKRDIKEGKPGTACACPIARAVARHKGCENVVVGNVSIFVDNKHRRVTLPEEVKNFILRFDQDQRVRPFRFVLDLTL